MNRSIPFLLSLLCAGSLLLLAQAPPSPQGPKRLSLSVRDADLKDLLRAAAEDTDFNLTFEPGIETRVKGMDLKNVTLQEILDQVLPNLGLGYVRTGRTLHIQKSDGGLRFFQVDHLAMRRQGAKEFLVNASGQLIQATGGGGGGTSGGSGGGGMSGGMSGGSGMGAGGGQGGSSSSYTSTLTTSNGFDPWEELRAGLTTLIFGEAMGGEAASSAAQGQAGGPQPLSFAKDGRTLVIHPESGLVVVGAEPGTQKRVETYLEELRRRNSRQVLLEARIVEVTLGTDSQIGVDWNGLLREGGASGGQGTDWRGTLTTGETNNPAVSASEGIMRLVVQNARLTATLSALAREGRLQVLSAPRLSTLNNQKAILRVVREEAFFLQNSQTTGTGGVGGFSTSVNITPMVVPVGIVLDILPQVSSDGTVTLAVNPSVSEIVTVRTLTIAGSGASGGASASLPVVDRRDLDTVVRLRSGETLVLAGIIRAKASEDDRGVPWLRKVPFLGNLFSKREKAKTHTELAIFITPTLVEDSQQIREQQTRTEERLGQAGAELKPEPRAASTIKEP
ncbi:MAG: Type II secretion system protein D precursor [Acidobacteria bacterium ADurb.Bin340]|nr:MAG: Type II secretion system protein D precursor [Acidobacteria bacterium ADurb.Bin340]